MFILLFTGLAIGGAWGVREGARRPLAVSNTILRINSILNSVTRRGTFIGNSAGVAALMYNGVNSTIDSLRGKHDSMGSMAASALTGAIFKSTDFLPQALCSYPHFPLSAGIRPLAVAAILGSSLAGIWSYVKKSI